MPRALSGLWIACLLLLPWAAAADPLPVEVYAALPVADAPRLSPDGRRVAMISPKDGKAAVRIWHADGKIDWLVPARTDQLHWIGWKGDDHLLLGLRFTGHNGARPPAAETRLLIANVADQTIVPVVFTEPSAPPDVRVIRRSLFQPPHVQDRLISVLPDDQDHILLAAAQQDWQRPQVMQVDIHFGAAKLRWFSTRNVVRWLADPNGAVRLAVTLEGHAGPGFDLVVRARLSEQDSWQEIHRSRLDHGRRFIPVAFSPAQPSILFVLADQDNGRLALESFDIGSHARVATLAADAECDIEPVQRDNRLLGYINRCRGPDEIYFDPGWQQDQALLGRALQVDQLAVIDRSADGRFLLLRAATIASAPPRYWYFDRTMGSLTLVADSYPAVTPDHVAKIRSVTFQARDGQTIPALLTLPPDAGVRPIGFVVLPHGGPSAQDTVEWDWLAQSIAGRGVGVLQPQFRGSTGHGAEFERAGYGEWGGRMQDDITDASRWLIARRLADPARLCIAGVSYGGYAALMGAEQQPDLYRCAAAIAPVTDLPQWIAQRMFSEFGDLNRERVAGDRAGSALLSPLDRAAAIRVPLLVVHGRQDFIVPVSHSEALERRLREAGTPAQMLYLDHADHYFGNGQDRLQLLQALDGFLDRYLADPPPS